MSKKIYETLALRLTYPEEHQQAEGAEGPATINPQIADTAAGHLDRFAEQTSGLSLHDRQELFIRTFDLSPVCSLEMGWHLFGENYDRGLLLVKMRQQLRAYGLAESTELPDHLTNGLRLLARMEHDSGEYFAEAIVLPALEKMLEAIRGKNNPYEHILEAARLAVGGDFPEISTVPVTSAGVAELRVLA